MGPIYPKIKRRILRSARFYFGWLVLIVLGWSASGTELPHPDRRNICWIVPTANGPALVQWIRDHFGPDEGPYIRLGINMGAPYFGGTRGPEQDFQWVNSDSQRRTEARVREAFDMNVPFTLKSFGPMFTKFGGVELGFWLQNYRWNGSAWERSRINCQWYQDNWIRKDAKEFPLVADDNFDIHDQKTWDIGGHCLLSVGRYVPDVRRYAQRNLKALAAFCKTNMVDDPKAGQLFLGLAVEGEAGLLSHNPTPENPQDACDYNPYVVREYVDWCRHAGEYAESGRYAGQGRKPAIDKIEEFNRAFGTSFTTWSLKYEPEVNIGTGALVVSHPTGFWPPVPPLTGAFGREWDRWRYLLVDHYCQDLVDYAASAGLPDYLVHTHQIPGKYVDFMYSNAAFRKHKPGETDAADDISAAANVMSRSDREACSVDSADVRRGTLGITTYGVCTQENSRIYGRTLFEECGLRAQRGSGGWSVWEFNPVSKDYNVCFKALRDAWANGCRIITVYDVRNAVPGTPCDGWKAIGVAGTNFEIAIRDFVAKYRWTPFSYGNLSGPDTDGAKLVKSGAGVPPAFPRQDGSRDGRPTAENSTNLALFGPDAIFDPPAVHGVKAVCTGVRSVAVYWDETIWPDISDADWVHWPHFKGFEVSRNEVDAGGNLGQKTVLATDLRTSLFIDTTVIAGKRYAYSVVAANIKRARSSSETPMIIGLPSQIEVRAESVTSPAGTSPLVQVSATLKDECGRICRLNSAPQWYETGGADIAASIKPASVAWQPADVRLELKQTTLYSRKSSRGLMLIGPANMEARHVEFDYKTNYDSSQVCAEMVDDTGAVLWTDNARGSNSGHARVENPGNRPLTFRLRIVQSFGSRRPTGDWFADISNFKILRADALPCPAAFDLATGEFLQAKLEAGNNTGICLEEPLVDGVAQIALAPTGKPGSTLVTVRVSGLPPATTTVILDSSAHLL